MTEPARQTRGPLLFIAGCRPLPAALLCALLLAGCGAVDRPLPGLDAASWRTANDQPVDPAQFAALRRACDLQTSGRSATQTAPVGGLGDVNPAYRPGGEGLINSSPFGIASEGLPPPRSGPVGGRPVGMTFEECLTGAGLTRAAPPASAPAGTE